MASATPSAVEPAAPRASSIEAAAARLAALLVGGSATGVLDPSGRNDLVFEADVALRPLRRGRPPADVWAVDGGQALVADARCLQLLVTRAAVVRFRDGRCVREEEGPLRAHVVGPTEREGLREALGLDGLSPDCAVDVNLLRDRWEWEAVERVVDEADEGALVLVDGDLQPDWRIPSSYLARLLRRAASRAITVVGVTKHSSLARRGAPLLGQLEQEGAATLGDRALWWAPVARTRPDVAAGLQVVVARLDPDAPFAFRVDLPAELDPAPVLAALSAVSDDAGFPGYPYPLTVADRLAACPGWLRREVQMQLDDLLDRAGVPLEVRERAFADRHARMERS